MATLYISEYLTQPIDRSGWSIPVPQEPALAVQTVNIGGASAQSAPFNDSTHFIRVHTDAICSVKFGTNPVATTGDARMVAGQTEFFGVYARDVLAVIANT